VCCSPPTSRWHGGFERWIESGAEDVFVRL
jgi:hypothetical protein